MNSSEWTAPPVDNDVEEEFEKFLIPDFSKPVVGYEFDFDNVPLKPAPIIEFMGHTISTPGNITNIQAKPKEGKTAIAGGILSAVIAGESEGCDTLGFTSKNPQGGWVLTFDSEQSKYDNDANIRLALKRSRYKNGKPKWLRSFCLTELSARERYRFIFAAMKWAAAESQGLFMVIIDGVADLCFDVNDATESGDLIDRLQKAAIKYNCAIVTVLHENPGSDAGKMRGHLGSQIERKAETALRVAKDSKTGVVTIWAERARHCMIPKSAGHCIAFDESNHCFMSCGSAKEIKDAEKMEMANKEIEAVFKGRGDMRYKALCDAIIAVLGLKIDAAKKRVREWRDAGLISHVGDMYSSDTSFSSKSSY